jgi:hypothetical protein
MRTTGARQRWKPAFDERSYLSQHQCRLQSTTLTLPTSYAVDVDVMATVRPIVHTNLTFEIENLQGEKTNVVSIWDQ